MSRGQGSGVRDQGAVRQGRVRDRIKAVSLWVCLFLLTPDPWTLTPASAQSWSEIAVPAKPAAVNSESGQKLYSRYCAACHGSEGEGDGPAAKYLDPRPRVFTSCTYKLRTTKSGELPTDEDLYRSIAHGLKGSAMPAWKDRLKPDSIWNVLARVKTFCPDFSDPELDPIRQIVSYGKDPGRGGEIVEKGKAAFEKQKCWECHARNGKGHGEKAFELQDDWGQAILPRNLTAGRQFRGGFSVEDIFLRLTTGINGSPMPSYDTAPEEDRWVLAHYVRSLGRAPDLETTILSLRAVASVPEDPWDPLWAGHPALQVLMSGQVIIRPRWQNPAVDLVSLRGVYTNDVVAFLLEWDDHTESRRDDSGPDFSSYDDEQWQPFAGETRHAWPYSDTISLQFPVKIPEGPVKPHFFWGSPGKAVDIWEWKAATDNATEYVGQGYRKPLSPKTASSVRATGVWKDGVWRVLFQRSLQPADGAADAPFEAGRIIPVALQARDGSSGEIGPLLSLSSWYGVVIEAPVQKRVYAYTFLSILLVLGAEIVVIRRVTSRRSD